MKLPMIGTVEKLDSSRFQVTLVDKTNKDLHPTEYPRIHRFFDNLNDRDSFIMMFDASIVKSGGKLIHNEKLSHPYFASFDIFDKEGNKGFGLIAYH